MLTDSDGNIIIDNEKNTIAQGSVNGSEFWTPINDELNTLETHFNEMIDDVSNLIREVETKSNNILGVADNIFEIAGNTKATMQENETLQQEQQEAIRKTEELFGQIIEQINVTMADIAEHTGTLEEIAKELRETIKRFKLLEK